MSTVMCRTKFYARAFLLTSYRAHQWYFELCKLAKRVANDRLHQHCRDVSKQYRTTRSGLQMQACKAYFRTFVLLAPSIFWPIVQKSDVRVHHVDGGNFWIWCVLSSCPEQLEEHFSEPKDTTSNPLNRNSSILLWEVENVVAYRGLNRLKEDENRRR